MYLFFLFSIIFTINVTSLLMTKTCSITLLRKGSVGHALSIVISAFAACIFFFFSSGCNIDMNLKTLIFSLTFGALCTVSNITPYYLYRYAPISTANAFTSSASIMLTAAIGFIFFSETITLRKLLKIFFVLMVIFTLFIEKRLEERKLISSAYIDKASAKRSNFIKFIIFGCITVINGCAASVLSKLYTSTPGVCDNSSYFFMTNVAMLVFGFIWLFVAGKGNLAAIKNTVSDFGLKPASIFVSRTFLSNIGSLISMLIYATNIDISLLSPISSALGLLAAATASLLLREKLTFINCIATTLAIIAVVI